MKLLLASSEVYPYSKTGGLADMVGGLAKTLARLGHEVGLVTPFYAGIREQFPGLQRLDYFLEVPLGSGRVKGEVWTLQPAERLTIYFVDQPGYFHRSGLYQQFGVDYPDNAQRFIFFAKAVGHLGLHLSWRPELVHLHDWQTGLTAVFLDQQRQTLGAQGRVPRTCVTLHNIAYQGVFAAAQFACANLPWSYFSSRGLEFYGRFNCLKGGIAYADVLTTVSPRYAREITTEEFGCGLDGLLRERLSKLTGILNGVDYGEWNTNANPHLKHPFSVADPGGKAINKAELQQELGLPVRADIPLFISIGRLVEQKGVDILAAGLEEMLPAQMQFALLGSGESRFEGAFQQLAKRFPDRAVVRIGFDEGLSHRLEAGGDFFLMPSKFEPCGLNQMYSLRYGTVPVVRATGGLDDTVIDIKDDAQNANGIKFSEYSGEALAHAIRKALALYAGSDLLAHYRRNGMSADFSWDRTAAAYEAVYRRALGGA